MQRIDEPRLESDLEYRFGYLIKFVGFTGDDIAAIHGAAKHLAPLVPALVDAVYDKLFSYDATKRHFVPKQSGYDGPVPDNIETLTQDHEMIQFRKQHLGRYLTRLVSEPYDGKMLGYLDRVGKIHTPKAGSEQLDVLRVSGTRFVWLAYRVSMPIASYHSWAVAAWIRDMIAFS